MSKPVNHYRVDPAALAPVVAYVRSRPYEEVVGLLDGLQAGIEPRTEPPCEDSIDLTALKELAERDRNDGTDRLQCLIETLESADDLLEKSRQMLADRPTESKTNKD